MTSGFKAANTLLILSCHRLGSRVTKLPYVAFAQNTPMPVHLGHARFISETNQRIYIKLVMKGPH
jgi:hypothetical protein